MSRCGHYSSSERDYSTTDPHLNAISGESRKFSQSTSTGPTELLDLSAYHEATDMSVKKPSVVDITSGACSLRRFSCCVAPNGEKHH